MAENLDVSLFENDIYAKDGDFCFGESDVQHCSDTIAAFPGWWKEHPQDGVGIFRYLHSAGKEQQLERSIKINLMSDGYRSDAVSAHTDAAGTLKVLPNAQKL